MNSFRADLHCHTTCSDGTDPPEVVIRKAKEAGLQGLSITDHDTVAAYPYAFELGREWGIDLISGIELSAREGKEAVHILGYAFRIDAPSLTDLCAWHIKRRQERNRAILQKLAEIDLSITEEEMVERSALPGKKIYGRPHIAQLMIDKGYVANMPEAFRKYLGDGAKCFVAGPSVSASETIRAIQAAGGKAILAHPHLIRSSWLIKKLLTLNFDGIEGYYATLHSRAERPWVELGNKRGWLVTGGSDYHGSIKKHNPLGSSWVSREVFEALRQS